VIEDPAAVKAELAALLSAFDIAAVLLRLVHTHNRITRHPTQNSGNATHQFLQDLQDCSGLTCKSWKIL